MYHLSIAKEKGFVSTTADHVQLTVVVCKTDSIDGRRVIIQGLNETIFVFDVEYMQQAVTAGCRQQS